MVRTKDHSPATGSEPNASYIEFEVIRKSATRLPVRRNNLGNNDDLRLVSAKVSYSKRSGTSSSDKKSIIK